MSLSTRSGGRGRSRSARRAARWPAWAALALISAGCVPNAHAWAASPTEQRIASLVRDWFNQIETRSCESGSTGPPFAAPSLEVSLANGAALSPADVESWLADLRSEYPNVEFRIGKIDVVPAEAHLYRARFTVDRQAWDDEGTLHIARFEYSWFVRELPDQPLAIARIEERRSLAYPGTGPRIVCN